MRPDQQLRTFASTESECSKSQFASLSPAVWRASTVVFQTLEDFVNRKTRQPDGFSYGTTGTPTHRNLEARIADLEKSRHCVVAPSGQAAICLALLALVRSGDHLLMTESAYGPAKTFATAYLARLGVDVELYDPRIGADIGGRIRENTRLVWLESPGSITMEVQDVPSIVAAAAARSVRTAIDNTWAGSLGMRPLDLGVDLSVQACTKYMGGHSDVLMGSVCTNDAELYARIRELQAVMGQAVSAEDCFLISRGLDTLHVRMRQQAASTIRVSTFLQNHPCVRKVLYPALPESEDHQLWKRDFSGAGSLMSLLLVPAPPEAYSAMFAAFRRFAIGASWGGVHSVAAFYPASDLADRRFVGCDGPIVRLSIGIEEAEELVDELELALNAFDSIRVLHTS